MFLLPALILSVIPLPVALTGAEYDSGPIGPGIVLGCRRGMPYYRLVRGVVPEGLELRASGSLAGSPLHAGHYEMTLELDNGCTKAQVTAKLAVLGRAILAAFDTDVELSPGKPEATIRVSSDHPGMPYMATSSEPWVKVHQLMGRTPRPGEALAADLVTVEVDRAAVEQAPDHKPREAVVHLTCFRCRGTAVTVKWRGSEAADTERE
jgi:hypothetical protein